MKCFKCQKDIKGKSFYGLHVNCFLEWFELPGLLEFSNLDPKKFTCSSSAHSSIEKTKDSFYHGRYRKYSAILGSRQYILKVQEPEYPDLPATEYLCNRIASILSLNVPNYYLIRYKGVAEINPVQAINEKESQKTDKQEPITFITRNFMQDYIGNLNHIYKYLPKGEKHYNCENIVNAIKEQTRKLADVEKFIEICLFDAFIGNHDRHGRNLGIIDTGKNRKLAPMYDNPSFLGTEKDDFLSVHFNPSGCIWTSESKEPKLSDYIKEFKKLTLERACQKFIKKIIHQFPLFINEIKNSEISERRKKAFIKLLKNRLEDCKKSIKKDLKNV